jgi:glycosyltransferase involved in cell wall biosynthesis
MVRGPGTGARLTGNYLSYAIGASLFGIGRCGRRFDLIFVYEPSPITVAIPGILASRLHRAPLVMWVQDLWPDVIAALVGNIGQFGFALLDKFTRWIYRNCDLLLTASLGFVHRLQEQGVDPRRIKYIPNWAEPVYRPIDPDAVTISRDDIPQGFVVMFAGNLGESQSLETVISAVESVPVDAGIKWVFIGDGRRRQWMAGEVSRRKIDDRVVILPRKPIDKMPEYFCLADVLLVTLRDERLYELTVPSKLQTYLACARPILAALNGEGARIIKDSRAGEVVPAGDSRALAEAVQRLAALSKTERNQMGDRGYQFFLEHFERERVLTRVYRLLDEAMACK